MPFSGTCSFPGAVHMLGTLTHGLQKFFGFVGASLTGITAIFTAMGFLAERARLTMLGLPSTSFDLQQYLETGARMFAFLPIYLGTAFLLAVSDLLDLGLGGLVATPAASSLEAPTLSPRDAVAPGAVAETLRVETTRGLDTSSMWLLLALLLAGTAVVLWRYRTRWQSARVAGIQAHIQNAWARVKGWSTRHRMLLLLLFLLVQFAGACQQARTIRVQDVLFEADMPSPATATATFLFVPAATLEGWVRQGAYDEAVEYFGWLFFLTLLTGWALYVFIKRFDRSTARTWERFWIVASMLLLVSQITLLPVNYGVLLSSNQFPSVCVAYAAPSPEPPAAERLGLVHENDHGYYLYSPARHQMWFVQRERVEGLQYYGMIPVLAPAPVTLPCEE